MVLLITKFSQATYHFIPVRSKYCLQHPFRKLPFYSLPLMLVINFHIHTDLQVELICII
jgi:hypothetical protein